MMTAILHAASTNNRLCTHRVSRYDIEYFNRNVAWGAIAPLSQLRVSQNRRGSSVKCTLYVIAIVNLLAPMDTDSPPASQLADHYLICHLQPSIKNSDAESTAE
jgi:hypothetical protein